VALTAPAPAMADDAGEDRIRQLFDREYGGLCRLAYLIVGDRSQAEDVVMDAFVRTFASWRRIRDVDRADAYLRRAVVNASRSRARRRQTEQRGSAAATAAQLPAAGDWDTGQREGDRVVLDAVRQLPHGQRAAVVLRYYQDLPEADIARALGCSVGTVKSQLAKARAALAERLAAQGELP
jgi:RNA polymerase sigma-70 factor (sigma-E family)